MGPKRQVRRSRRLRPRRSKRSRCTAQPPRRVVRPHPWCRSGTNPPTTRHRRHSQSQGLRPPRRTAQPNLALRARSRLPYRAFHLHPQEAVLGDSSLIEPQRKVDLRPYTTLRAGGPADFFLRADDIDTFAEGAQWAWKRGLKVTPFGWGSNVLPADAGVSGLVVLNRATTLSASEDGNVMADSGVGFGDLFIKTAQAELAGLEFAVGIPGSVGGALVSNAGAYRSCISEFLVELEVVTPAGRAWVGPEWMGFAYRDSVLRRPGAPAAIVLRVRMR
ncbi:FAD-binding protein, partial [bacterium]